MMDLVAIGNVAPPGWTNIRHCMSSKIRCASWVPFHCDLAPRETQYRLYNSPCPECTGDDPCVISALSYISHNIYHPQLTETEKADKLLDDAVRAYWTGLMRFQCSALREMIPDFPISVNSGVPDPVMDSYHFFCALACSEDASHITLHEGDFPDCERCNNIRFAAAHNLLRALMQQEARVVWDNRTEEFNVELQQADDFGYIEQLRGFRHMEEGLREDWYAEEPDLGGSRGRIELLEQIRDQLQFVGPEAESEEDREYVLVNTWSRTVEVRCSFAKRISMLIDLDTGISSEFRDRLDRRIQSLLLPWPVLDENDETLIGDIDELPTAETQALASGIDRYFDPDRWTDRFFFEKQLIYIIEVQKKTLRRNAMLSLRAADKYLAPLSTSWRRATEKEAACVLCGDEWIPSDNVPSHLGVVQIPCCQKPFHRGCLKRLLRPWDGAPKCPYCRTDLRDTAGWFGEEFQKTLAVVPEAREGFIISLT
jgi:hypothetical protein